ncbi:hypothetical protein [Butyrivibrio proteoclasticus]|uniref:hypothetical protein n=1 Tax=Butyrivibrio proteoclasticus TaxID=43305 RepID=UPI00047A9CFE|nr:hypothetical protein [Butyrivibrio proteoclasticus]
MIIFGYTFVMIFIALVLILGIGAILTRDGLEAAEEVEGELTAAMCTTKLLENSKDVDDRTMEDFVIEQDLVYTFDSVNLDL